MTDQRILLDSSVAIPFLRSEPLIRQQIAVARELFTSVVVAGELLTGAYRSNLQQAEIERVVRFLSELTVLNCTLTTAVHYARIRDQLRRAGHAIPRNDVWIAATALEHDLTLMTRDRDFTRVADIRLIYSEEPHV